MFRLKISKILRELFSCFNLWVKVLELKKFCLRARFGFKRHFLSKSFLCNSKKILKSAQKVSHTILMAPNLHYNLDVSVLSLISKTKNLECVPKHSQRIFYWIEMVLKIQLSVTTLQRSLYYHKINSLACQKRIFKYNTTVFGSLELLQLFLPTRKNENNKIIIVM